MKKINIIFSVIMLALIVVGCESYDDVETDRLPIVGFPTPTTNINRVPEGGEKSATISVFISQPADVDRTFEIIDIRDSEDPELAAEENYTFERTVTIPANERKSSIEFTAIDVSLTTEAQSVVLQIVGTDEVYSGGRVKVSMKN